MMWQRPPSIASYALQRPQHSVEKHYGWFRHFNGLVRDPRWKLIANKTGVPRMMVIGIVMEILEFANQAKPRGSLEDFSSDVSAVALDLERGQIEQVYAALEEIGYIDQGWIVEWHLIQREKEDPTSTERSRRRRERLKEERKAAALAKLRAVGAGNAGAGAPASAATPLHSHLQPPPEKFSAELKLCNAGAGGTAPPRSDHIIKKMQNADEPTSVEHRATDPNSEGPPTEQVDAQIWLFGKGDELGEGVLVVSTCISKNSDFSRFLLRNWLADLKSDYALLRTIIEGAAQLRGSQFQAVVHERVMAAEAGALKGPPLPFGPTPLAKSGGG
jgi:hypothetical protein